jgi:phosphatidylglycerol---prolipoprotein diacylglyceryl transferase
MNLMAIQFPGIDLVAFTLGPVSVRWYGLAYMAGLILGWLYMRALLSNSSLWRGEPPMSVEQADDFLLWATIGTVVGGRLGFILFYEPSRFIAHPLSIFMVWQGGMAFHGGLLGVGLAVWLFARRNRVPLLGLMDLSAAVAPFGLFFGRLANFINGEMYGRLTDVPWAVAFPARFMLSGDFPGPRHPTQIYEALLEGAAMFVVLRFFTHWRGGLKQPGLTAGVFLAGYACMRIFVEYYKEWDVKQFFTSSWFSEGMVYSLPMLALGLYLVWQARRMTAQAAA